VSAKGKDSIPLAESTFGAASILNRGIFLYGAATAAQYTERAYGLI
jgi:hypothetical protein